jgi:hypothetical protein
MRRDPSRPLPSVEFRIFSSMASSTSRRARTDSVLNTDSSPSARDGFLLAFADMVSVGDRSGERGDAREIEEF